MRGKELMLNLELQEFIFGQPNRLALMNYVSQSNSIVRIGIYRNHSFELVEHTISAYLDFAGLKAEFVYSDYDDSLSFFELDTTTDMLILWLDIDRYQSENIENFLKERLQFLKLIYKKPIMTALFGDTTMKCDCDVVQYDFAKYRSELGDKLYDLRLEKFSGTKMSPQLCMYVAKDLGLNYIPALVKPSLKALIFDLDNTLYEGVLGEDGYSGIQLTEGHLRLQKKIKRLKEDGFFLGIVSKNQQEDVLEMFSKRKDFPLQADDFDQIICSWNQKGDSILLIANRLNIGTDSMLFVDDNIGELISVNHQIGDIKCLKAEENAEQTLAYLENYPGLLKLHHGFEDTVRSADLNANIEREALKNRLNEQDYIRSLKVRLVYNINNTSQAIRISELANKTNQFIFNYKRYTVGQIMDIMQSTGGIVIAVELSDRLSDSGIIGVCVAKKEREILKVEEIFVSCRALGRGIDPLIVEGAINVAAEYMNVTCVQIQFQKGERNIPAEQFVEEHLAPWVKQASSWKYCFPQDLVEIQIKEN